MERYERCTPSPRFFSRAGGVVGTCCVAGRKALPSLWNKHVALQLLQGPAEVPARGLHERPASRRECPQGLPWPLAAQADASC